MQADVCMNFFFFIVETVKPLIGIHSAFSLIISLIFFLNMLSQIFNVLSKMKKENLVRFMIFGKFTIVKLITSFNVNFLFLFTWQQTWKKNRSLILICQYFLLKSWVKKRLFVFFLTLLPKFSKQNKKANTRSTDCFFCFMIRQKKQTLPQFVQETKKN